MTIRLTIRRAAQPAAHPAPDAMTRPGKLALLAPLLLLFLACAPRATDAGPQGAAGSAPTAAPAAKATPVALPREATPDDALCAPLLIEQDFGFGTHLVLRRLPTAADFDDMRFITGLRQVLLALPAWPQTYAELKPLQQSILPEGAEIVVLLPGWPPSHEALGAWNLVSANLRLIMVVDGPPADRAMIDELNHMPSLERVIAQMREPSRSGFERLQRPLSYRVVWP
jgi:hypothetical protein